MLSSTDFETFFAEVHGHEPFPWQRRLLEQITASGEWPSVLALPTSSGKTAAIDIAVFNLALETERGEKRRAPVRIAFVVDRRLVVDDAFSRAKKLEEALDNPRSPIVKQVAQRLSSLAGDGPPLIARRLRGGIPREDDWARTPAQPTVLCSTVDQVGSRLLFRGYGVSDSMKPVHAGLIGSDCLILLDEAHLAEPFRQTLEWVRIYRGQDWRECKAAAPWGVSLLTATLGEKVDNAFSLQDDDKLHPVLKKRLAASKPARLVEARHATSSAEGDSSSDETDDGERDTTRRVDMIREGVERALDHFKKAGEQAPAIGVVVNRVARARAVFRKLADSELSEKSDCLLLIGPSRPVDRDQIAICLAPIRTGAERPLTRPLLIVATQCIEAGVDIDLDAMVTELAPLDCLRQRFGRLNRAGRDIASYGAILAAKSDLSARAVDPVYGQAMKAAWECLMKAAQKNGRDLTVDFGIDAFDVSFEEDALSEREDAPILLPAHLDLLSQTSPIPAADPEVSLYLHGNSRQPDSISVVWRADIDPEKTPDDESIRRLLMLVPPRSLEAIELPLWAVRRWLMEADRTLSDLADVAVAEPERAEVPRLRRERRKVFRWRGNDKSSRWIDPADRSELRPGDTIIVPAYRGGVDRFGWNPAFSELATDVGRQAGAPFVGRRFAVRVAPGLLDGVVTDDALADALAQASSSRWQDIKSALAELGLPKDVREDLAALEGAKRKRSVSAHLDIYGLDDKGRPRGVVFVAPFGIKTLNPQERTPEREHGDGLPNATEDDVSGSIYGFPLTLRQHSEDVERKAGEFAKAAGLSTDRVVDLRLAGFLHDEGKRDQRFQAWLHYGDALGLDTEDDCTVLAKSSRPLPPAARAQSNLPENWRHEALSVRLARSDQRLLSARDPDLVLWLVGSHHGYGRPFFPHVDPIERAPDIGPQSPAFDWDGLDWPMLFQGLVARYGVWDLARMEAILRLADHRASEDRAKEDEK